MGGDGANKRRPAGSGKGQGNRYAVRAALDGFRRAEHIGAVPTMRRTERMGSHSKGEAWRESRIDTEYLIKNRWTIQRFFTFIRLLQLRANLARS